jgi:hypothetical protein
MTTFLRRWFGPHHGNGSATRQPITVVSGLPRSGTSLMMKMLEAGGLPVLVDHERQADVDNPQGYYEFERVKGLETGDTTWLTDAPGKAVKVISALLPHLPSDYHYHVLFMERELSEVLASQRKMLQHRAAADAPDDQTLKALLVRHLHDTRTWLTRQPHLTALYVPYKALLHDPKAQIQRIANFVNTSRDSALDPAAMHQVIDPTLYRNRQ